MSVHFHRELESLRRMILELGTLIQDNLARAVAALIERDPVLAESIVHGDGEIDRMEVDIEEHCLKVLALHHPVAQDLRFIVAALKINNDLERMGDIVTNIAKRARFLARNEAIDWPVDLEACACEVRTMVRGALDALIDMDPSRARHVCAADDRVDAFKREMIGELRELLGRMPDRSPVLLKMIDVPRHLERIADLSTNIAEDVIYMVEGRIVRHGRED